MDYAILDSGVLIARVFPEAYTAQAQKLMTDLEQQNIQLVAPLLLSYELVSVVRKIVYQGRATQEKAKLGRKILAQFSIKLYFDDALLDRAYDLATELNRVRAYDTQFLALAERFQCDFWTTDEKFYNIADVHYPTVKWIGNYQTP